MWGVIEALWFAFAFLLTLKLGGVVVLSWAWVLAPLWLPVVVVLIFMVVFVFVEDFGDGN